ncbi:MAG: exosortase-associated EpsI family protein [Planctomycetota bacterium]
MAALLLLLAGGALYRTTAAAVQAELSAKIRLPRPLSDLPLVLGSWEGVDVPIRESVQKIAMNDDFVHRQYRNRATGEAVSLYIAYTARPRTMLRHRPTVCYPSAGWSHLGTETIVLTPLPVREGSGGGSSSGPCRITRSPSEPTAPAPAADEPRGASPGSSAPDPCHLSPDPSRLSPDTVSFPTHLHTFLKADGASEARIVVLNWYVLNGRVTVDEHSFWSLRWRDPNPARDAARYVAQVQITAPLAGGPEAAAASVRSFAEQVAPAVAVLLPPAQSGPP